MFKFAIKLLKNEYTPLIVPETVSIEHEQLILVRTDKGEEVFKAIKIPCCVRKKWDNKHPEPLKVIRALSEQDIEVHKGNLSAEIEASKTCKSLISKHKLSMNLSMVKYTFDRKKISFYYTAPSRVDFRNLLKDLTQTFKRTRIDLRHIGVRDETAILEGVGLCGREYCCASWRREFNSINIKLAKDQGIPVNPSKISGACGRLLCCLEYEYSTYLDSAVGMPPVGSGVMTPDGIGRVSALHFLNGKVAVKLEDGQIKDFAKNDIEMINEVVSDIEITSNQSYSNTEDEQDVDISQLED